MKWRTACPQNTPVQTVFWRILLFARHGGGGLLTILVTPMLTPAPTVCNNKMLNSAGPVQMASPRGFGAFCSPLYVQRIRVCSALCHFSPGNLVSGSSPFVPESCTTGLWPKNTENAVAEFEYGTTCGGRAPNNTAVGPGPSSWPRRLNPVDLYIRTCTRMFHGLSATAMPPAGSRM